ncbi:hypothetical protein PHISP_07913 [Aspergillus sp. HF37]|nr:hypothetical protein PHISP_07913 [Aspergillus sp. HF37]
MAVSTLTLVAAVSQTSGVNCSSLQSTQDVAQRLTRGKSSFGTLSAEIISISSHESVQLYWRDFVRTRLEAVRGYVGIASISHAREILEKVWARSDIRSAMRTPGSGESQMFIQWIEVMAEEKLETVLG